MKRCEAARTAPWRVAWAASACSEDVDRDSWASAAPCGSVVPADRRDAEPIGSDGERSPSEDLAILQSALQPPTVKREHRSPRPCPPSGEPLPVAGRGRGPGLCGWLSLVIGWCMRFLHPPKGVVQGACIALPIPCVAMGAHAAGLRNRPREKGSSFGRPTLLGTESGRGFHDRSKYCHNGAWPSPTITSAACLGPGRPWRTSQRGAARRVQSSPSWPRRGPQEAASLQAKCCRVRGSVPFGDSNGLVCPFTGP